MPDNSVLQGIVDNIFQINAKIRYVVFADANGMTLAGGIRKDVHSYDSDEDQRIRTFQRSLSGYMAKDWERNYGRYDFSIRCFQKLILLQFPFNDLLLNISTEPDIGLGETIRKIGDVISRPISTQF